MNQVVEAKEDCGILEEFIPTDYMLRFSMPLKPEKHGFMTLWKLIQTNCSDIVKKQDLQVGKRTKVGYMPSMAFRKAKDRILERVKSNFIKLITIENGAVIMDLDNKERQNNGDWKAVEFKGNWYRPIMKTSEEENSFKNMLSVIDENKMVNGMNKKNEELVLPELITKTEEIENRNSEVKVFITIKY